MSSTQNRAIDMLENALAGQDVLIEAEQAESPDAEFQERLRAFALLEDWRRQLEDALKCCKDAAARLSPDLLEDMAMMGVESSRVRINETTVLIVMKNTQRFVTKKSDKDGVTTQDICDTLRSIGLGDLVKDGYSASSLKSKVLEWLANDVEIPEPLSRQINIAETTKLITRKG